MLAPILMRFDTPEVRDLAWTLGAPPSVFIQNDPRLCSTQYYEDRLAQNLDWLTDLDGDPASLIAHLNNRASSRLVHRETLVANLHVNALPMARRN